MQVFWGCYSSCHFDGIWCLQCQGQIVQEKVLDPEDEGSVILQNTVNYQQTCITPQEK